MSLARGKYGIEYNPNPVNDGSSGLGWIVVTVIIVALVSLVWTLIGRFRSSAEPPVEEICINPPDPPVVARVEAEAPPVLPAAADSGPALSPSAEPQPAVEPVQPVEAKVTTTLVNRPVKVRNLLMRLEEAEKRRDVEMAATTIETLRALPGSPAADLDDPLARRLGRLNVKRLFERRNAQWVRTVTVKRGDSASRIAAENGATLASLAKLNGGNVDKIVLGRPVYVMNHPRFNLVIHRRLQTADLSLNGKFFKRYDLQGDVTGKTGAYELPARVRNFWRTLGLKFKPADVAEIEMLLPAGTSVLVSEM